MHDIETNPGPTQPDHHLKELLKDLSSPKSSCRAIAKYIVELLRERDQMSPSPDTVEKCKQEVTNEVIELLKADELDMRSLFMYLSAPPMSKCEASGICCCEELVKPECQAKTKTALAQRSRLVKFLTMHSHTDKVAQPDERFTLAVTALMGFFKTWSEAANPTPWTRHHLVEYTSLPQNAESIWFRPGVQLTLGFQLPWGRTRSFRSDRMLKFAPALVTWMKPAEPYTAGCRWSPSVARHVKTVNA